MNITNTTSNNILLHCGFKDEDEPALTIFLAKEEEFDLPVSFDTVIICEVL